MRTRCCAWRAAPPAAPLPTRRAGAHGASGAPPRRTPCCSAPRSRRRSRRWCCTRTCVPLPLPPSPTTGWAVHCVITSRTDTQQEHSCGSLAVPVERHTLNCTLPCLARMPTCRGPCRSAVGRVCRSGLLTNQGVCGRYFTEPCTGGMSLAFGIQGTKVHQLPVCLMSPSGRPLEPLATNPMYCNLDLAP